MMSLAVAIVPVSSRATPEVQAYANPVANLIDLLGARTTVWPGPTLMFLTGVSVPNVGADALLKILK